MGWGEREINQSGLYCYDSVFLDTAVTRREIHFFPEFPRINEGEKQGCLSNISAPNGPDLP